jgi:hypothetical protein
MFWIPTILSLLLWSNSQNFKVFIGRTLQTHWQIKRKDGIDIHKHLDKFYRRYAVGDIPQPFDKFYIPIFLCFLSECCQNEEPTCAVLTDIDYIFVSDVFLIR